MILITFKFLFFNKVIKVKAAVENRNAIFLFFIFQSIFEE